MRDEAQRLLDFVRETIRIGEDADLPVQITHYKVVGRDAWGLSVESLALVDAARSRGIDITLDHYLYTAAQTSITVIVPLWAQEGDQAELVARLRDPETRRRIKPEIVYRIEYDRGGGDPRNVVIGLCEWDRSLEGKTLADIAVDHGFEPTPASGAEAAMDIIEFGGAR